MPNNFNQNLIANRWRLAQRTTEDPDGFTMLIVFGSCWLIHVAEPALELDLPPLLLFFADLVVFLPPLFFVGSNMMKQRQKDGCAGG